MGSEFADDQAFLQVAALVQSILSATIIAKCVEKSLAINMGVQMHFSNHIKQSMNPTWMVLALPMVALELVNMFGVMLLEQLRTVLAQLFQISILIVLAQLVVYRAHHHMLETITTVSQPIRVIVSGLMFSSLMILSGMVNNATMKVHAALIPTLHHGSVWSCLKAQVKILKYVSVIIKTGMMKIHMCNKLNSIFSNKHANNCNIN